MHQRITSSDGSVWLVDYRGTPVAPVIKKEGNKIVFEDQWNEEEVGKTAFLHKVDITLTDDSQIDTAHAVYSELSDEGYTKYEFTVTASATNIFDGDMIRFGSGDVLSFWFHIEFIHVNESDSVEILSD